MLLPAPDKAKLLAPGLCSVANSMSMPWGYLAAGAMLIIIPVAAFFLYIRRFFESGLRLGDVKG